MKTAETREVYVTKYWETAGIQKRIVADTATPGMVKDCEIAMRYYHNSEWYDTYAKARENANKRLAKRIASTEKKLKKLKSLMFE